MKNYDHLKKRYKMPELSKCLNNDKSDGNHLGTH